MRKLITAYSCSQKETPAHARKYSQARKDHSIPLIIIIIIIMIIMIIIIIIIIMMEICSGIATKWLFIHCFQIELEFRSVDFCGGSKTGEPGDNPRSEDKNQQQTQPRPTAMGGECSHHCAIPADMGPHPVVINRRVKRLSLHSILI